MITGPISALHMRIRRLCGARRFQVHLSKSTKNCSQRITLVSYRTALQKPISSFSSIQFEHVSRIHNKHADALATLTWKVDILDEAINVRIMRSTLRTTTADLIPVDSFNEQDWQSSIIRSLNQASSTVASKDMKALLLSVAKFIVDVVVEC